MTWWCCLSFYLSLFFLLCVCICRDINTICVQMPQHMCKCKVALCVTEFQKHSKFKKKSFPRQQNSNSNLLNSSKSASARANFVLRTVRPELAGEFCVSHDAAIWKCLTTILGVQASAVPELTHSVTPSHSRRPRSAERIKDTHRRVLGELGGWVGHGPETPS